MKRKKVNKRLIMIAAIILFILSLGTYATIQMVNASTVEKEFVKGQKYYNEQHYEEAIIAFENVLKIDEKHVEARIGLSNSHLALNHVEKARDVLVEGIEIIPEEPEFYIHLSELEIYNEQVKQAVKILDNGYEKTKSKKLANKIEEISKDIQLIVDQDKLQIGHEIGLKLVYQYDVKEDTEQNDTPASDEDENNQSNEAEDSESSNDEQEEQVDRNDVTESEANETEVFEENNEVEHVLNLVDGDWTLESGTYGELAQTEGSTNSFKGLNVGEENVIVRIGSITKQHTINVEEQILNELIIEVETEEIHVNEEVEIIALGKDMDGKEITVSPKWEITDGTGTLSSDEGNRITFISSELGRVTIVARDGDQESMIQFVVTEKERYGLVVDKEGKGNIVIDPKQEDYEEGTVVTIHANAAEGWEFDRWAGSATNTATTINITMNQSKKLTAIFKQIEDTEQIVVEIPVEEPTESPNKSFTLTTTVTGKGKVSRNPNKTTYNDGERVELTAIPEDGWLFDKWINHDGKTSKISVIIDQDRVYEAVFVQLGQVEGIVKNAVTGEEQEGITVTLRSGKDTKTGEQVKQMQTGNTGVYKFTNIKPGDYTVELAAEGFVSLYKNITVKANETVTYHEAINPKVDGSDYRVVLTWDERPWDLDSHLRSEAYHIYFGNDYYEQDDCQLNDDSCTIARLDVDETNGRGPETITFSDLGKTYNYFVHNWSQDKPLTESNATVVLYKGDTVLQTYTVPTEGSGDYWKVFDIKDGQVTTINKIVDQVNEE